MDGNGDKTFIRILTLTINKKQFNTVQYTIEIDQSAASIRVELMISLYISSVSEVRWHNAIEKALISPLSVNLFILSMVHNHIICISILLAESLFSNFRARIFYSYHTGP